MAEAIEPRRPLWQRRWFQVMVAVLVGLLLASFIVPPIFALVYEVRSVLLPVLIGFILAYVVNPAITAAKAKYRIPRWASASAIMLMGLLGVVTFGLLAVPPMVAQGVELVRRAQEVYPQAVAHLVSTAQSLHLFEYLEEMQPAVEPGPEPGPAPESAPAPDSRSESAAAGGVVEAAPGEGEAPGVADEGVTPEPEPTIAIRTLLDNVVAWLQDLEWSSVSGALARSLDIGVGVVSGAISFTTYLGLSAVIIAFCFFYFAWQFDRITGWFVPFIPASQRARTLKILKQMDRSVSAFIRGRLVQVAVMMVVLSAGWFFAGTPYWLLLGVLTGLLNLIPFAPVFGFLLALILTIIDHAAGAQGVSLWTFVGPTLVYIIAQSLDGWVVEPIVQGKATNLDPLTVLLVVLIGGALAGLLGMLIAIPTAACIKILAKEVVLPRLRELAAEN